MKLDVTKNPDVIDAAADALWQVGQDLMNRGEGVLADAVFDIHGMLFVDVEVVASNESSA